MNISKPEISVILPTYNHAPFLKQSISSIFKNCKRDLELIIINDGSTDNTSSILSNYKSDNRIKIIEQENIGLAETLNKGFAIANGNYLTWTSADNLYKNSALDKLANYLDRYPDIDMVYANVELINDNGKLAFNSNYRLANQDKDKTYHLNLPTNTRTLACYADNFINACFMYRSWISKILGGYRKDLLGFEDYEYWLRILVTGKIAHIDSKEALYQYRLHEHSLTSQLNAIDLSLKQRAVVGEYYKLLNRDNNKQLEETPEFLKIDHDENVFEFLKTLPLEFEFNSCSQLIYKFEDSTFICDAPIKCPEILSRAIEADYKAHSQESNNHSNAVLFVPDFIERPNLEKIAQFIRLNSEINFTCICNSEKQNAHASYLEGAKLNNLKIFNFLLCPEISDNFLPEERFLPYVYAFSNISMLICPVDDKNIIKNAISTIAAKINVEFMLIGNSKVSLVAFGRFALWSDISDTRLNLNQIKHTQSSFNSWLDRISSRTHSKKINKLYNFFVSHLYKNAIN